MGMVQTTPVGKVTGKKRRKICFYTEQGVPAKPDDVATETLVDIAPFSRDVQIFIGDMRVIPTCGTEIEVEIDADGNIWSWAIVQPATDIPSMLAQPKS